MNPDDVFALLAEADPWPDPEAAAAAVLPRSTSTSEWRMHMQTIEPDVRLTPAQNTEPPSRRPRGWLYAAAAAAIGLALVVAALATRDDAEPDVPADDPPIPAPTREERAVATAQAFYLAVTSGDVDTVIDMTAAGRTNLVADRAMWELNAVAGAADGNFTITSCAAGEVTPSYVEVDCAATADSPVWQAIGITELVAPVQVFDDQTTRWLPFTGANIGPATQATAEYLREFHPEEYEDVCDPTAYDPAEITHVAGLALTRACAELWVPFDDEIAQWIEDGRPTG
ncbi:MAG: hypothetical protein HKN41_11070 [Ilumatobacter sp.]|nr:hypothetical protein [Ilumatobacter sp.]